MPRAQCFGVNPARVQERARFLDRVLLVFNPGDDIDLDAERGGAVPAGLAVAAPVGVAKIVRAVMRAVGEAALELLLLQDLAIMRDLLAGVFVVVDQTMSHAVRLMKPDRRRVVADVPKSVLTLRFSSCGTRPMRLRNPTTFSAGGPLRGDGLDKNRVRLDAPIPGCGNGFTSLAISARTNGCRRGSDGAEQRSYTGHESPM